MGDAENGPSKKRAAGRELSRDNPGLDDEDTSEVETGTFKRASEEVLATRRIVKVRRQQTTSNPSPNPFAGIRFVGPDESNASAGTTTRVESMVEKKNADDGKGEENAKHVDEQTKEEDELQPVLKTNTNLNKSVSKKDSSTGNQINAKTEVTANKETEDKLVIVEKEADNDPTLGKETEYKVNTDNVNEGEGVKSGTDNDEHGVGSEDKKENDVQSKEQTSEAATLKSFQQLSSTQNAFTGLAGTGFSSSTFSFGSVSNDGSAFGGASSSIFGSKDKPFGLGLSTNGNSSAFSSSVAGTVSKSEGSGFPALHEVPVETGEENEKTVFTADSILFEFVDQGWKERGKGELKVNVTTSGKETARLLMRARGNYRLILNARLYADMKLTNMDKRGVTFACINSATEGKDGLSTFALKFKDAAVVEEFRAIVLEHKDKATTVSRTPENSPKEGED